MRVTEENLPALMAASLLRAGTAWREVGILPRDLWQAMHGVYTAGAFHLPPLLLIDLMVLATEGMRAPLTCEGRRRGAEAAESASRRRYERDFLARLRQHAEFLQLVETVRTSPDRSVRCRHLVQLMAARLAPHYPQGLLINPSWFRKAPETEWPTPEALALAAAPLLEESPDFPETQLAEFVDNLSRSIRWSTLIREADLFEIEHLDLLAEEHLRQGCRQVIECDQGMIDDLAGQIPRHEEQADASSLFVDDTHYPTGGLDGLTNRGSLESLVSSELAFIDAGQDINLFDLRMIEGELLYYMRDDGELLRIRRELIFILSLGDRWTFKSSTSEYQYSIIAQALALRLYKDFATAWASDALRARIIFLSDGAKLPLVLSESRILSTLLRDPVRQGRVRIEVAGQLPPDLADPRWKQSLIWLGRSPAADEDEVLERLGDTIRHLRCCFREGPPEQRPQAEHRILPDGMTVREIHDLRDALLTWLL